VKFKQSQSGVTLLEAILVLGIASVILLMGMRQAEIFNTNKDLQTMQFNVDELFNAAASYYKAQCGMGGPTTVNGAYQSGFTQGLLVGTSTPQSVTLSQLSSYLPSNWSMYNPLISGYIVQFNLVSISTPSANCTTSSTNTNAGDCGTTSSAVTTAPLQNPITNNSSTLQTLIWEIQVSVILSSGHTGNAKAYAAVANATCVSTESNGAVQMCNTNPANGGILTWERLPSFASPNGASDYWSFMPMLKQFNLMYTHDQMFELTAHTYLDNGVSGTAQGYYTCGE
jgi:hypothetical protein